MVEGSSEIEQSRINNKEILSYQKTQKTKLFNTKFDALLREAEEKRIAAQREQERESTQAEKEAMDSWQKRDWNFTKQQIEITRVAIIDAVKSHLPNVDANELNDAFYWLREAKALAKPEDPKAKKRRWLGLLPPKKEDPTYIAFYVFRSITRQPPHFNARHPNLYRFLIDRYNTKNPRDQIHLLPEDEPISYNRGSWLQDIKLGYIVLTGRDIMNCVDS